jgi:hypothetical protein
MTSLSLLRFAEPRFLERFRVAGATSRESSRTLSELDVSDGAALQRLIRNGVVRSGPADTYYIDEISFGWYRRRLRLRLFAAAAILVLMALAAFFRFWRMLR